jgi:hypothetical protein
MARSSAAGVQALDAAAHALFEELPRPNAKGLRPEAKGKRTNAPGNRHVATGNGQNASGIRQRHSGIYYAYSANDESWPAIPARPAAFLENRAARARPRPVAVRRETGNLPAQARNWATSPAADGS